MPTQQELTEYQIESRRLRAEIKGINTLRKEIRADWVRIMYDNFEFFRFNGLAFGGIANKFRREIVVSQEGNPEEIALTIQFDSGHFFSVLRFNGVSDQALPRSGEIIRYPVFQTFDRLTNTVSTGDLPNSENYRIRRIRPPRPDRSIFLWIDCIAMNQ